MSGDGKLNNNNEPMGDPRTRLGNKDHLQNDSLNICQPKSGHSFNEALK